AYELNGLIEPREVLFRCRRLGVLDALKVFLQQHVALQRSFRVKSDERVQLAINFGLFLRTIIAAWASVRTAAAVLEHDSREDLLPEPCDVIVYHRHGHQTRVDH